jgi:hypothetical protein
MSNKEIPAFVCSHVFTKRGPVLLVSRADGDWQLLCGSAHDEAEIPQVVGLNHVVDDDPSLREIMDLPSDWEAERSTYGSEWERRPIDSA